MIDLHHLWMFFDWVKKNSESTNSSAVAARQRAGWCLAWAGQRLQIPPSTFPEFKLGFICPINAKSDTSFLPPAETSSGFVIGIGSSLGWIFFFQKVTETNFFLLAAATGGGKTKFIFICFAVKSLKKRFHQFLTREREASVSQTDFAASWGESFSTFPVRFRCRSKPGSYFGSWAATTYCELLIWFMVAKWVSALLFGFWVSCW